jgi:two-component system, OmpR family, sensor kinase
LTALLRQSDSGLRESGRQWPPETVAQVLDRRGSIVDATAQTPPTPLLDPTARATAWQGARFFDGADERLLAVPVRAQDQRLLIVVGSSTEPRARALGTLRRELLLGGPATLLLVSLLAYALAHGALRPVEAMRRRAAAIGGERTGERLPIPRARDEIALLGSTLNEMLVRLEQALERERRFVADASHELRTPLALLKGEIELALEDEHGADELRAALRAAGEETDRLVRLAEDLLLLARADRGVLPVRRERVELGSLLSSMASRFELRAREAGRRIVVEPTGLAVLADRLRLEQALSNLIDNALRHGGGTVRLRVTESQESIGLHVADQGTELPAQVAAHAFEPFARGRGTRGEGSGLGLAIVAAVAKAHHGRTQLASGQGGTDAAIELPRTEQIPDAQARALAATH